MYPRNAASPERIAVGPVVQISDGAVQTSGVSIKVKPQGASASAGGGTISYEEGIVGYVPTQSETNHTSFQVLAYKTGCIPAAVTVVTSAANVAGKVVPADDSITASVFDETTAFPTKSADAETRILDRIEFTRGHHTVSGSTFYVDGVGGNDTTGNGRRSAPWKTISKALTAVTSNMHDEIVLLPNSGGGPTTITETAAISVTKNYVQIRGPGRDVVVTRSNNGDIFDVQANGVELSGFRISTFGGATSNAVVVSGGKDFARLHRLWIENAHQDAIYFNVANRCEVTGCVIIAPGRDGVRVSSGAGSGTYNLVLDNVIRDCVGSAVNLQGSDASDCRVQRNVLRDNAVGVTVSSGVTDTVITDNRFVNNGTNVSGSGIRTLIEWNSLGSEARSAVGLATANLDTQLGDLPTNSELATALAAADDVVLAAISALNNLSSAGAQAAAVAALTAYAAARTSDVPSAAANASQVRVELATELARLDASSSSISTSTITSLKAMVADGTITFENLLKLLVADQVGKVTNAETSAPVVWDTTGTIARKTATNADEYGNRSGVVVDLG